MSQLVSHVVDNVGDLNHGKECRFQLLPLPARSWDNSLPGPPRCHVVDRGSVILNAHLRWHSSFCTPVPSPAPTPPRAPQGKREHPWSRKITLLWMAPVESEKSPSGGVHLSFLKKGFASSPLLGWWSNIKSGARGWGMGGGVFRQAGWAGKDTGGRRGEMGMMRTLNRLNLSNPSSHNLTCVARAIVWIILM